MLSGEVYTNRKSGKQAVIVEVNDKSKMVIFEVEGKPKSTTISNFGKSYRKFEVDSISIEEENTEQEVMQEENTEPEEIEEEGLESESVIEEVQEEQEETENESEPDVKKECKHREPKHVDEELKKQLIDVCKHCGYSIKQYPNEREFVVVLDGVKGMKAHVYIADKFVRIRTKKDYVPVDVTYTEQKHMLNASIQCDFANSNQMLAAILN